MFVPLGPTACAKLKPAMQTLVLALLLAAVFSYFSPAVQGRLQNALGRKPALVWGLPPVLTAVFAVAAAVAGAFSLPLAAMVLVYTAAPVAAVWLGGDFAAILLLWLPIEFNAGARFVSKNLGFLHSVAYGIAILMGLTLFLGFRKTPGMKFNLPRHARDFWLPLAGFALAAPVLALLGVAIGFIPPLHWPTRTAGAMAAASGIIFAATALPEEILFRALIQNLLVQRFGRSARTLLLASVIFGLAHLDNGPQPLPNWRYAILATIAGVAYGAVFQNSSTVLSSAALHTMVDWTKHFFF